MTLAHTGKNLLFRHRFANLFLLMVCLILIPPYFEDADWIETLWSWLFTLALFGALYSVAGSRRVLILGIVLLIPTVSSTWLAETTAEMYLVYLDNLTNIVYFGLICAFLGQYILSTPRVTPEVIFAAMCLYMILAVLWAAIFTNLELYYGNAFTFNGELAAEAGVNLENLYRRMIYYSFVTLSTLGYGDIIPVNQVARNWAGMEAMIGQFFTAIVIARLVSVYTAEEEEEETEEIINTDSTG